MNSKIKFAVASALALAGGQAFALSPSAIVTANSAGTLVKLYISGATSTDPAFENLAELSGTAGFCSAGTLDTYYYKSSSGSVKTKLMACTAGFSGNGVVAGTTALLVAKESFGGSANGIINVANASTGLSFIDITDPTFTSACTASTAVASATNFAAYSTHDCGYVSSTSTASTVALTTSIAPDAGVSDVDPATFVGIGGVSAANVKALKNMRRTIAVTFNPIVSLPLALAIQKAEGIVSSSATATSDTSVDNMPSLPASVLRSIFTGDVQDASQIYLRPVGSAATTATQLSTVLDSGSSPTTIYLCRRGDSSGSQLTTSIEFLGYGCSKNSSSISQFAAPDTGSCQADGCAWTTPSSFANAPVVFAGAGSGDVRSCVAYYSSQGALAVGVVSTEAKPATATNDTASTFRYIRVDGQAPTLKAVMEGNYSYFAENSFNDTGLATATTGKASVWNQIYNNIGNPTSIAKINSSWQNAAQVGVTVTGTTGIGEGDVGVLDLPSGSSHLPTLPVTAASVRTNPINGQTKLGFNISTANNCNAGAQAY